MIIIGVDTGGTFTDFLYKDEDKWGVLKRLSTPGNPAEAVLKGLEQIANGRVKHIVHGSTVSTNAILERKGVKTALTNKGFEDIVEIGRQNRSRLYDLTYKKEPHIVPKEMRFGLKERTLCTGEVLEDLDMKEAEEIAHKIKGENAESVAVCLLFSYLNPSHEKTIGTLLEKLNIPVSLSHEILSEFREFERTSTTLVNAYVSPKMREYLSHIQAALQEEDSLRVMQSNGGSISAHTAMNQSVRTILSGPAGGAVGAYEIGKKVGAEKIISFDMGGTSTDVSLMDGGLSFTLESEIAGYPVKVPMIDIHTVGAGGGSIASIDLGGSLRVGPESAGAEPGPICYGKGDRITVTDAHLYLGRLIPERFLGGNMTLETDKLKMPFSQMAEDLGLSAVELAEGILSIANTVMEKAIRVISVERGYDPREFTLLTFGGAGGMHAAFLARLLSIPRVLVPNNPGILSAIGMLIADMIKDYSLTVMLTQFDTDRDQLRNLFSSLERKGLNDLISEGVNKKDILLERYLDMRYEGQSYEIMVPLSDHFIEGFHGLHEKKYGYRNEDKPVEIVNLRLRARGALDKPGMEKFPISLETSVDEALLDQREVIFDGQPVMTQIFNRESLGSGNRIKGPAVVVEYSSTIVIPPFAEAVVDEYGNLILEIGIS
jgi:N-methylhydantoinase A